MTAGAIIGAIPARYESSRLPGKPLLDIAGRPMIEHVYRRVQKAEQLDGVVVLTDDARVSDAVRAFGGECEMTPPECASGTDRIAFAAAQWQAQAVINIQGDEPLIEPQAIDAVAQQLRQNPEIPMVTLAAPIAAEDIADPNTVKVVTDRRGFALYFSRAPIPFPRRAPAAVGPASAGPATLQHIGMYGYRREILLQLAKLEQSPLERCEALEQLRALENGIAIRVLEVEAAMPGVDTPQDLARVRALVEDSIRSRRS